MHSAAYRPQAIERGNARSNQRIRIGEASFALGHDGQAQSLALLLHLFNQPQDFGSCRIGRASASARQARMRAGNDAS